MDQYFTKSFIFCLIIGSLLHFTYNISGKIKFIGYFSAINESIWEHTKLATFPILFFSLFIFIKHYGNLNNFFIAVPTAMLISTLAVPILFYSYIKLTGTSIFLFDISIFIIACYLGCKTLLYILSIENFSNTIISIIGLLLTLIIITYFAKWTYNPPNHHIFTKIGW